MTNRSPINSDFLENISVWQRLFSLLKTIKMEINSSKMIKTSIMSKKIELITLKRKGQFYKVVETLLKILNIGTQQYIFHGTHISTAKHLVISCQKY